MNELIEIKDSDAMDVFTKKEGLEPYIQKVKNEVQGLVFDVSTRKGRDHCASIAAKIAKSKTYLDGVGKELVAELKKKPKIIDAERKRMRDILDQLKADVRAPLTEWEEKEKARRETIEQAIEDIKSLGQVGFGFSSDQILSALDKVEAIDIKEEFFCEFTKEAAYEKGISLSKLKPAYEAAKKNEEEQAELLKIRLELEKKQEEERERARIEQEKEKARKEAEELARIASEKAKAELEKAKLEAEQKEKEAKEKEERQKKEIEEAMKRARLAEEAMERARIEAEEAEALRLQNEAEERARVEAEEKKRLERKEEMEQETLKVLSELTSDFNQVFTAIKNGFIPNVKYKG